MTESLSELKACARFPNTSTLRADFVMLGNHILFLSPRVSILRKYQQLPPKPKKNPKPKKWFLTKM